MANSINLAPHEMLELHELISTEALMAKKVNMTLPMVKDQELKAFMIDSLEGKKISLTELTSFLESSNTVNNTCGR